MDLAMGREEGLGSKNDALILRPKLVCRKMEAHGIVGYVVYDGKKVIASARYAADAWWKAYHKIMREPKRRKR